MRTALKAISLLTAVLAPVHTPAQSWVPQEFLTDQLWQFSPDPGAQFTATTVDREALGRLITDDSACCRGFHLQSDFADWHSYYSIPDHAACWADWVQEYAGRPKWLFSPYGDAITTVWQPMSPVIDGSILGWEAASVTPDFVIDGLQEQHSPNVLAGVFYGWLNSNRAYLAELRQGPGRMLVTTFRFQAYGHDPFATMLLHQMLGTTAAGKT